MMLVTGIDVIGRYFLNRPIGGADEIIGFGMAILIFGSLPLVALNREQITVDVLSGMTRGVARRVQSVLVALIGSAALGYLGFRLFVLAGKMLRNSDHSTFLQIPYAPVAYFLATMAAVSAAVTFATAFARVPADPAYRAEA